jgi:hypothetical protein
MTFAKVERTATYTSQNVDENMKMVKSLLCTMLMLLYSRLSFGRRTSQSVIDWICYKTIN